MKEDFDRAARRVVASLDQSERMRLASLFAGKLSGTHDGKGKKTNSLTRLWLSQPSSGFVPPDNVALWALGKRLKRMEEQDVQNNTLGLLNEKLFAELENLEKVDVKDTKTLDAEVERAKAVEGISKTIIDNAETVLAATRMRMSYTKHAIEMPKLLEG
jgi:hypothetical protein